VNADPDWNEPSADLRGGSHVLRIRLGARLRELREACGLTAHEAGYQIRGSHSKIYRMELGRTAFKERDITDLLALYGVTDPDEHAALLTLMRGANLPAWWHEYSDIIPDWLESYVALESTASLLWGYELQFVHGLLQSADYARAVIRLGPGPAPFEQIERQVELRLARQRLVQTGELPRLWAVLDEAALRRPIGGRTVMRGQIRHLLEMAELPNVTLQIVPFRIGGHAAAGGGFTILRFAEPSLSDVVYLEHLDGARYLDRPRQLDRYMHAMNELCAAADRPEQTPDFLHALLKEI
jgi:transcriptional regulator with XRE-family HTH domain